MTSQFKPAYCVESALPEVTEGQFYVTTDTNRVFADLEGIRVSISEFITVPNEASLPLVPIRGKLYVALAERTLWIYSGGWLQLQAPATASSTSLGVVKVDGTSIKIAEDGTISTDIADIVTQEQLNAINSGITAQKVVTYDGYEAEISTLETQMLYFEELNKEGD